MPTKTVLVRPLLTAGTVAKPAKTAAVIPIQKTDAHVISEWFVLKGENRFGPFNYTDLVKMLQQKVVFPFDFIWHAGLQSDALLPICFLTLAPLAEATQRSTQRVFLWPICLRWAGFKASAGTPRRNDGDSRLAQRKIGGQSSRQTLPSL